MERKTFSYLFYIKRSRLLKNGEAPIYLKITINGESCELSAQRSVNPLLWNQDKKISTGKSKSDYDINESLESLRNRIYAGKKYLEEKNLPVTAMAIRDYLVGNTKENAGIVEIFQEHNKRCQQLINIDYAPATVTRYESTLKHLKEFLQYKYKAQDKPIRSINHEFIKDFELYLKTKEPPCGHNSTVKYIRNFRKIIKMALDNDWIQKDPFRNIKYSYDEVERDYLTHPELMFIIGKDFSVDRLQHVKDIFVFSCFTGLAYAEVKGLTKDNIQVDIDGVSWIQTKRKKTGKTVRFPLPDIAVSILNKYKNHPLCIRTYKLLPVLSNQKMNAYLKEVADLCGIHKQITFHTARHTCATTVELAIGVPIDITSKKLGHSSITMTEHYAKVGDPRKKAFLSLINSVFSASLLEKSKDNGNFPNIQAK